MYITPGLRLGMGAKRTAIKGVSWMGMMLLTRTTGKPLAASLLASAAMPVTSLVR